MQSSSEQPLIGEEHCVTTLITAAKETTLIEDLFQIFSRSTSRHHFVTRAYFATGKVFPCAQEIFS